MFKSRGYSNEFSVSLLNDSTAGAGRAGLVGQVCYPDGSCRLVGYDESDVPSRLVETDGATWSRSAGSNHWSNGAGETWCGTVEVIQPGTSDAVPGTIIIHKFEDGFLVLESILFPNGIAVTSNFSRDRTELARRVRLLNGRELKWQRAGRHALWYGSDGCPVEDVPANAFQFAQPHRHPAIALMLSRA